ncbi:MAG: hypothetical protein SO471_17880 [Anaerobutyricum hallii]|uniref:hypothetical protein n=1 Tax=Anaerobutyricum hallii TaxID=39488 RepID=UPI002A7FFB4E|nr:hypothetical protein [Anaerobutyricum hallii]MDY4579774.1 hypothetical protein [Anaerobutyricum hallii]
MSSKLKRKQSPQKKLMPFSNRQIQHFSMEFHATRDQLKKMEEDIWRDAWNEAEEWSNIVNTVTTMMALHELYRWKGEVMLKVVKKANEYVGKANRGEQTILQMMDELQDKYGFCFDEGHREVVRRYGL